MLSSDGAVKILDFGIAKALGGDKDESTKTGTLKGKFAYMAPEQTVSNEIDRRIDIFATGIVLHEILTGRRLFKGENDLQTIEKVRQCDVPPPSLHNPLCPPEMDNIVLRALAKNPSNAFSLPRKWPTPLTTLFTRPVSSLRNWPSSWAACFPPTPASSRVRQAASAANPAPDR